MSIPHMIIFSCLGLLILLTSKATEAFTTGVIVDESSRIGKEQRVTIEIAKEDFVGNNNGNQDFVLHFNNSQSWKPMEAALAAENFIDKQKVQAILGPQTWEETKLVAEIGTRNQIPILSFSDTNPEWAKQEWPFLLQASQDNSLQMQAIASIIQSWDWHRVTLLYEDGDSFLSGFIPEFSHALKDKGAQIERVVPLSPSSAFNSTALSEDLGRLKAEDCRVFVVHCSLEVAINLFQTAQDMEMMEEEYVWITTDMITSLVHSVNASTLLKMQGVVGVRSYFPDTSQTFQDFARKFRVKFRSMYPEEDKYEPGIHAVQAYIGLSAFAFTINSNNGTMGLNLLDRILNNEFQGLSGNFSFINRRLGVPVSTFQIINVAGEGHIPLGFWTDTLNFHKTMNSYVTKTGNSSSMRDLGQVFWPGRPQNTPRGWVPSTSTNKLRIGVPELSGYKEYINVADSENGLSVSGFVVDVFQAVVRQLPFDLQYEFIPFKKENYTELLQQIDLKVYNAVIGDVAVVADRYKYAEFSHPFTETGLAMIVPTKASKSHSAFLFLRPFTAVMWVSIVAITLYNGFVIWCIERKNEDSDFRGFFLWSAFTTLFSLEGGNLLSNLSRMAMVVWLFVAMIVTQTYTANLASLLTVKRLEPTVTTIEELLKSNVKVGYCTGSYLNGYMMDALGFKGENLVNYTTLEDYYIGFQKEEIAAAFMEAALVKLYLKKYCKGFMQAGPVYNIGGFGFAFPRGSPILPSINEALLKISENGTLLQMEEKMLASESLKCSDTTTTTLKSSSGEIQIEDAENSSINVDSYWLLFAISGGTTTIAFVLYVVRYGFNSVFGFNAICRLIAGVFRTWRVHLTQMFRRRVNNVKIPEEEPAPGDDINESAGLELARIV